MGLALENFDGAGQFRATENGAELDVSGELDGKPFKNAVGLGEALRNNPSLPSCLVKRVYSYATGGVLLNAKDPMLKIFEADFAESGYRVVDLLRDIAVSEAFSRIVAAPAPAVTAKPKAEAILTSLN